MAFWKRRAPDPDVIRFDNLKKLCDAAKELAQNFASDPEATAFLQEVREWAVRKMIEELE